MQKNERLFHNILSFIVLFASSMLSVPVALMMFTNQTRTVFTEAERIMPVFAVFSVFFGYAAMYIFAKMTGKVNSEDGYAVPGKDTLTHFHVKHTIIPFALFAGISILLFFLASAVFQVLYNTGHMEYISEVYSIEVSLIFFFSAVLGCVVWFYPMERLTNTTVLITAGVIFYAEMFFATLIVAPLFEMGFGVLTHPTVTGLIGPPFIFFTVCILVIFNQSNMQRKFRGSVVAVITPSARVYNLFIIAMVLLILIAAVGLMYVVIGGISIILYAIFFVIAYKLFYGKTQDPYELNADYVDSEAVSGEFQRKVMSPENQYLLALFFLIALTAVALVILAKTGKLKELIIRIKNWFRDLLESFRIGFDIFKNAPDGMGETEMYNYKDEKKLLQNAAAGSDSGQSAHQTGDDTGQVDEVLPSAVEGRQVLPDDAGHGRNGVDEVQQGEQALGGDSQNESPGHKHVDQGAQNGRDHNGLGNGTLGILQLAGHGGGSLKAQIGEHSAGGAHQNTGDPHQGTGRLQGHGSHLSKSTALNRPDDRADGEKQQDGDLREEQNGHSLEGQVHTHIGEYKNDGSGDQDSQPVGDA